MGNALHIICERDVGLFSLIQQVISNIPWAIREGRTPVVCYRDRTCYWTPDGYAGKSTVWEYYFEPVFEGYPAADIPPAILKKISSNHPSPIELGYAVGGTSFVTAHFGDHPDLENLTLRIPFELEDPTPAVRIEAHEIIKQFVHPRKYIQRKVDRFLAEKVGKRPIIGVHVRGTDATSAKEERAYREGSLDLNRYQQEIEKQAKIWPTAKILVATDDKSSLDHLRSHFGNRVISYATILHQQGEPASEGPTGWIMPAYIAGDRSTAARNGDDTRQPNASLSPPDHPGGRKRKAMVALMSLAVITAAIGIAIFLVFTKPRAGKRHPHKKMNPLVSVISVQPETHIVTVRVMGTVVPAKELTLKSRVAGEIVRMHSEFTEGGLLRKDEEILRIDDQDYRLIVAQKQSAVADARYALKLEMGRQEIARREWQLLNGDNPSPAGDAELALRKPHLEKAQSDLIAAEADLEAAKLQLARTNIHAPFNAIVRSTSVQQGSQVTPQENIATLVNTDTYWVQASIPVDQLQWIEIPGRQATAGSEVVVRYQDGAVRTGRVIKLLSDLEKQGRMARLVIQIVDPLSLAAPDAGAPAMLIGEYVQADIQGRPIPDAYRIPREALRESSCVWIVGKDGALDIRNVQVVWRDTQSVILKQGLKPDERVVVSDLAAPIKGMAVEIDSADKPIIRPASTPSLNSNKG